MANNNDQNEYPVPGRDDSKRTNSRLLPKYFRTDSNKKFIGSTLDQLTSPGVVEKINGFVGRKDAKATKISDSFITDVSKERQDYQLEPFAVVEDDIGNVTFNADYLDLLGQLSTFGSNIDNHDKLFSQEFYAWDPHIDFDKFTNFREYYWLPNGPQEVAVRGQGKDVISTYTVTTVTDDDNTAFVFSPDGVTRNKTLTLYRGQTYRFEVDTPNHPFGIALSRLKKVPYSDSTGYVSNLYLDGVTITEDTNDTLVDRNDFIDEGFVEKGVLEFKVPENAPDNLYYISQNDINTSGAINLFDIEENSSIDVENEILGKKNYTTQEGWEFTNGMKIYFVGDVTPEEYASGLYYIEGVGEAIELVPVKNLQVPAIFTKDTLVPFDTYGFDRAPFGDAKSFAGSKDYICMNRKDKSRNAWARYNRWFHKSVIEKSAEINNQPVEIDQTLRAKRPIIEFESDLRLWNHGNQAKQSVDLIDTFTKDVFSTIEGSIGYNVDGIDLVDGMRILFTADEDSLVNGKIFNVNFIRHNNRNQISLTETSDTTPKNDETILALSGEENAGRMYWYNGEKWILSQDKIGLNQAPKFDLFDIDGNSLSDQDLYDSSDFKGNRLFNYRIGEGTNDDELGFPLTYKNFVNIGDIVFDFPLLNEIYEYKINGEFESIASDTLFLQKYKNQQTEYCNAWKKANIKSRQHVVRKFTGEELTNNFPIDVYDNSANLDDLIVKVYVNNDYKNENVDYSLINENKTRKVVFTQNVNFDDIVILKTYSKSTKNKNGYYEIPHNLERNPLNDNITEFTLGEVNDHVEGLVNEINEFVGIQPGVNNLRDLGNVVSFGRKFVQHSGPINLALYNLVNKDSNVVKSIKFAANAYTKFKRQFFQIAKDEFFDGTVKDHVDFIFKKLNEDKVNTNNFYSTDMLGSGGSVKIEYDVYDNRLTSYALNQPFNKNETSNLAVYVYINDEQIIHGEDYEFTGTGFVNIKSDLSNGDKITIHEYANTEGSFVPATPTKLGMYPAYKPEKFFDNTYQVRYDDDNLPIENTGPTNVIRGHDGSITVAFNDYRDDLLLELEKRIYNNLKVEYDTSIFDIHDIIGGFSRDTGVSTTDINNILIKDFIQWTNIARINDYTDASFNKISLPFTYNYSNSTNKQGKKLPGFWRGVYIEAYDTDRPHTHPWEMLGFGSMPSWWTDVYGPAPYTSNNLILWTDLQNGVIREPGKPVIRNKKYVRTGLLTHIPVNENGQLLSPLESSYVIDFSYATQNDLAFKFGDHAPVETAWRRSSDFPFAMLNAMLLSKPAHVLGIGFDRSRIQRNIAGQLIYSDTKKRIHLENIKFPRVDRNITAGFLNYISEYINTNINFSYENYISDLQSLTNKIGFKLAGYASKEKLKLVLDSKTPLNKGNVFVPYENYNISFRTSAPLKVITYSGVIIEKIDRGYKIAGYDKENPYFLYNPVREIASDAFVSVGGISESYLEWSANKTIIAGKIVRYNDVYYRAKENHNTGETFEQEKYVRLPSLPLSGGTGAYFRKSFSDKTQKLAYGTILNDQQSVVDFLLGYQDYLQSQGFVFDYYNNSSEAVENWQLSSKEFLFWTTQNWATSSIITLSPAANKLYFSSDYYVVDNVFDSFYNYPILDENGNKIVNRFSNLYRDNDNVFQLTTDDIGLYMIKLPLVQKEHVVLIDNTTVFNDTIYSPNTGYRQERLKVVGYRTDEWNGSLNIPGFIYDDAKVTEWESYKDYRVAELVKFKEFYYSAKTAHTGTENFDYNNWNVLLEKPESRLIPNWEYRVNQFADFYDLDSDNFDDEQQRLAQHITGYQKREYLANIIQDDVSQFKFYQGFIQDKGTKNSITKLFDKLGSANKDSVELYEEWAIRVGQYGAVTSIDEVEFQLNEKQFRIEPQTVKMVNQVDQTRTDLVYQIPRKDVLIAPTNYNDGFFPSLTSSKEYTKTAGYVKLDQINFIAKTKIDILSLDIDAVPGNSYVWVPQDSNSWNVYKHVVNENNVWAVEKTDLGFKVYFEYPIGFQDDEIIGINNINDEVNGFWLATNIQQNIIYEDGNPKYPNIEIEIDNPISEDYIDLSDSTLGIVSTFSSRRVATLSEVNNLLQTYDISDEDRLWIDDIGNNISAVYDLEIIREQKQIISSPSENVYKYGMSVSASYNNTVMAVGAPDEEDGKVYIYTRTSESNDFSYKETLTPNAQLHTGGDYGASVSISKDGQYLFVGAPTASNVKSRYKGVLDPTTEYQAGDIVSQKGTLWRAVNTITVESSTINLDSDDWEIVDVLTANVAGDSLALNNQGVVYIYEKRIDNSFRFVEAILSPVPLDGEKFGNGVKVVSPAGLEYNVVIRSQANNGRVYFVNNKGREDADSFVYNKDTNYKGEWQSISKYIENEIVWYDGELYKANQTVFAGNNWDSNLWTQLSNPDFVDYTGYIPSNLSNSTDLYNEDSSGFGLATDVGVTYDISANGELLALSGVINGDEFRIAIYKKENGRFVFSENIDSPVDDEDFGFSVSLTDDGSKLAVGAPMSSENGTYNGKVYIYKLINGSYVLNQELFSPKGEKNEMFGKYVKFSDNKLAVTSENGDTEFTLTLDKNNTTFDNEFTSIIDTVKNNHQVYIFETISDVLIYAEKLLSTTDTTLGLNPYGYLNRNHLYVVAPAQPVEGNIYGLIQDYRSNINENAWKVNSKVESYVDLSKIKGAWLYDNTTKDLITYLDYIDPIQGRIAGAAEKELTYKLYYDPAVYNVGSTDTGTADVWGKDNVGKLWWNLNSVKWYNPYQGDLTFKNNTWNKVVPGFDIDVYEWVESDYLPSEWDEIADTTEGLAEGVSGQSLYGDDSYSTLVAYDALTNLPKTQYYFWVKGKSTLPDSYNRKISALDVENLIKDPSGQGYRYISLFDTKQFSLHNVRNLIKDTNTVLHIDYYNTDEIIENNVHNEYQLLTEGLASSKPNNDIVKKWVDSLVGYNEQERQLPDNSVSIARRFGILNEPNQSIFVNRKEALKQIIERVNGILLQNVVVDEFDISPLNKIDPAPSKFSNLWDIEIESDNLLRFVGTAKIEQAQLTPVIEDGKIVDVLISNPGRGYVDSNYTTGSTRNGPTVSIEGTGSGAEIKTYINNLGQVIKVEIVSSGQNYLDSTVLVVRPFSVLIKNDSGVGGFWSVNNWISSTQEWFRAYIQDYDTTLYWNYQDWYVDGYDSNTAIDFIIPGAYALTGLNDFIGATVKIETIGSGGWLLLEKIDNQDEVDYTINYKTIGRQNGTIQFSQLLYQNEQDGFDKAIYDSSLYDREPTQETRIILNTLENNIFVDQLEVEWNKLFFSSVRYAMSEQIDLDWIFKSSFVTAKHNVGELEQKTTFQNDNLINYEDYINEVKPYSTKIREYISSYERTEPTQTSVTDFDLPPRYDSVAGKIIPEAVKFVGNQLVNIDNEVYTYPQKHWLDNIGFEIKEFVIYSGGSGYSNIATVTVEGGGGPTLSGFAYLGGDSISYIDVDTKGAIYYNTPTVTINGSIDDDGEEAIVYAIIGNNLVRNTHMLMKFDRVTGNYYFTTLNETETFVGNGGLKDFKLKWPASTRTQDIEIIVDGVIQLSNDYTISNNLDTSRDTFDRYRAVVSFTNAPDNNAQVVINYKKSTDLLTAADRINFFYNPTTGMPGKELSQLMDGVDYGGVQVDSIGFGELQGFEQKPFGIDFDTFDVNTSDEIIVLDGSTQIIELESVLETNTTYNVYLNNVRIDDPNYPGDSVTNPNAKMVSPQGDGITNTIFLDSDLITTKEDDIVIVRKTTSDGSFTPESTAFDVSLGGGNFEYTTATGIDAGDIVVDGDGFVTETTSKGPEEQVPGQVLDTVDIQVYNRSSSGQGAITVRNYITDGTTIEWPIDVYPQTNTSVIITVDGEVIDNADLNVDYENKYISLNDSTALDADKNLSILTIGTNGLDVVDSDTLIADGNTNRFEIPIKFDSNYSSFVTINGVLQDNTTQYGLRKNEDGFVELDFPIKIKAGKIINYTIYNGKVDKYSRMVIDNSMTTDGVNKVHRFDNEVALPVVGKPLAQNILVKRSKGPKGPRFLNPGYRKTYTMTTARAYDIDAWQFEDTTKIRSSDVVLYLNGSIMDRDDFSYDPINGRVVILNNNTGMTGDILEIFIIRDAEYYFINTTVEITNGSGINDPELYADVEFRLTDDSTVVIACVESFSRDGDTLTLELQGYIRELFQLKSIDDTPPVVASWQIDSTQAIVGKINLKETNVLSLSEAPDEWETVEIYTFNNHDVNEFERNSYDVVWNTNQAPAGTQEYIDKNLLSKGYVKLKQPAVSANYVWIFKNGYLLTPQNDYKLVPSKDGIQLYEKVTPADTIDVLQFAASISKPKFGFRIFKDMLNRYHFKRLNQDNEYELAQPLNYYDQFIELKDSTGIQTPNRALGLPGVVWIDKERIEYFAVDGNLLRQIRRGTLGTGIKTIHDSGTKVQGQGIEENIPYKDENIKTTFIGDGSTKQFILDFVPNSVNEIDVFLGGIRLRKDNVVEFDKTVDQDSPEADVTIAPEYTIENEVQLSGQTVTVLTLAEYIDAPNEGVIVDIIRRVGKSWADEGKSLADSENQIAKFITEKTISLPR